MECEWLCGSLHLHIDDAITDEALKENTHLEEEREVGESGEGRREGQSRVQ